MLCPLQDPFTDGSPSTQPCSDNLCSDDCRSFRRVAPFGVRLDNCSRPWYNVPTVTGQFWEEFTINKILTSDEKNSASKSIISFATHNATGISVVAKTFMVFTDMEDETRNLVYEIWVYQAMRQLAEMVPHFVTIAASYSYTEEELAGATALRPLINSLHSSSDISVLNEHSHLMLVTTRAPGMTIGDFLQTVQPLAVVQTVLFQLFFCLHAMTSMGFQHNDLHSGNVMVDPNPPCANGMYTVDQRVFALPMLAHIYIYDFDLSSCGVCGPNIALQEGMYCSNYGICDNRNPRFDIYTILNYIRYSPSVQAYPEIIAMFNEILGNTPVHEEFQFRMCSTPTTPNVPSKCMPFPPEEPRTVLTPRDALSRFFRNFEIPAYIMGVDAGDVHHTRSGRAYAAPVRRPRQNPYSRRPMGG